MRLIAGYYKRGAAVEEVERDYLFLSAASHLAATLRQRGFDVVSTVEAGNRTLDDRSQFAYAVAPQRVLLTFNIRDFVPLAQEFYFCKSFNRPVGF